MKILLSLFFLWAFSAKADGPAAGYVHLVKDGRGVWWFERDGRHFFSLGVACVDGCYGNGGEKAERHAWVPHLLKDWGFNTLGAWSSPALWDEVLFASEIYPPQEPHSFDVFSESGWEQDFLPGMKREMEPFLSNQNLVGYFLGNEPSWDAGVIWNFYAGLDKDEPGAQAQRSFLKEAWHDEGAPDSVAERYPAFRLAKLQRAWMLKVVTNYYRHYCGIVRSLDPQHLLLGLRYVHPDEEDVATALAPFFDVWSINDYNRYGHIKPQYYDIYRATGKPMMNSEWSFSGYPQPGRRSLQFVDVYSQEAKGYGYQKYVWEAAKTPFMVGMHFFLWADYGKQDIAPEEGAGKARPKGQGGFMGFAPDENMGLLSADEKPYEDFGAWCKRANLKVDSLHTAASLPPAAKPDSGIVRLPAWPAKASFKPGLAASLYPSPKFDHHYSLSLKPQALVLEAEVSDSHLDAVTDPEYAWEGDCLDLRLEPLKPVDEETDYHSVYLIYPAGQGREGQEPYAVKWEGEETGSKEQVQVSRQDRPGGFTLKVEVPYGLLKGFPGRSGGAWKLSLGYQNMNEIYQTRWTGAVQVP
jgi:hypothetical protein